MAKKKTKQPKAAAQTLRERAERVIRAKPRELETLAPDDVRALVHELHRYQAELEIQNEELREARIELTQSRDRYSDLYAFAPVGYVLLDIHGKVLEANLTAATILGAERQSLLGENLSKFIVSHSRDDFYLHRQAVFSSRNKHVCELDIHKADGAALAVRLESVAQTFDHARNCRTVLIDVTDLRRAHEQAEESEERLRLAAEATGFGCYDFDPNTGKLVWSAQLFAMFGLPEATTPSEEVFLNLVHPEDRSRVARHVRRATDPAGPGRHNLQYRVLRPDGEVRWIQDSGRTLFREQDETRRPVRSIGTVIDVTKQKRIDEELHHLNVTLEERVAAQTRETYLLAEAVSNLGEGVLITEDDVDWPSPRILFVNEAMCGITGYAADELVGRSPRMLQGKDTDRRTLERLRTELAGNQSFRVELINYRKDGTPYDAELFITPLFDEAGHRTNFVSIHRDITKRKTIEKALKASEQRLRLAMEAGGMGAWELNAVDNSLIWDNAQFEMFGIHAEPNLTMDTFLQRVYPADRPGVQEAVRDCLLQGASCDIEFRIMTFDGQIRWLAAKGMVVSGEEGRPERVIGVNYDITKAKTMTTALRNSEERLRMTLNTISEGILTTDPKGTILDFNPAVGHIFGYSRNELLGRNLNVIIEATVSTRLTPSGGKSFLTVLKHGDNSNLQEKVGLRKDGSRIPIEVSSGYGESTGFHIFLIRNISETRRLEEEILKISEEEKRQIAHDLHDSLGQELGGLAYMAGAVADKLHSEAHANAGEAKRIAEKIGQSVESIRRLSHSLDPFIDESNGLPVALALLARTARELFKMDCRFRCIGKVTTSTKNTAINLYRITQEAVHNAFRHGKATRVTVTLKQTKKGIHLKIFDNGSGLPTVEPSEKGIGIRVMKYRVAVLGGWMKIGNRARGGVEVSCFVPKKSTVSHLKQQ